MLVQFTVKNFLSFKQETTLDMTAINAYKEHGFHLIDNGTKEKLVKVAAIYGANASGKSNLYLAMYYFRRIIVESMNNVEAEEEQAINKYYIPFAFDEDDDNTEFQIVIILDGFEYKYGFEYNDQRIVSEWLYRKNMETNRTAMILERAGNNITFGSAVKRRCDAYGKQIPDEALVLSFFNKLNLETAVFSTVYTEIKQTIVLDSDVFDNFKLMNKFLPKIIDHDKKNLTEFLAAIDTGIKDIRYERKEKETSYSTTHIDKNGKKHEIDLFNESEGTIKSIVVFLYAKAAILNDRTMFIDELNIKLHPLLLKFIIDLFYDDDSRAQLIYTTHDTTLLDKKFFRRDQIWFVQKDENGYSELSALSDFKVRSDASFEKDYLAGVYGGIPLLKEFALREGE